MSKLSRIGTRSALWLLIGIALLVAGSSLMLSTTWGRNVVRDGIEDLAAKTLPGTLTIGHLQKLAPWGIALRQVRLRDPRGETVASIERVDVGLDIMPLYDGVISLRHMRVKNALLDARQFDDPRRGLTAALGSGSSDSSKADTSDKRSSGGSRTLNIRCHNIDAEQLHIIVSAPDGGSLHAVPVNVRGKGQWSARPRLELQALNANLARQEKGSSRRQSLGSLEASGHINQKNEALRFAISGDIARAQIRAEVYSDARELKRRGLSTLPLHADLKLTNLHTPLWRALGLTGLVEERLPPVQITAEGHGSLQRVNAKARLRADTAILNLTAHNEPGALVVALQGQAPALETIAKSLHGAVNVQGKATIRSKEFTTVRIEGQLDATELELGGLRLATVHAEIEGGPRHYTWHARATAKTGQLRLNGSAQRKGARWQAETEAHGQFQDTPLRLQIKDVEVHTKRQDIRLGSLSLRALEQDIRLNGHWRLRQQSGALHVEADRVHLESLSRVLRLKTRLSGLINTTLDVKLQPNDSQITLNGAATEFQIADLPPLNGHWKASAVGQGRWDGTLELVATQDVHTPVHQRCIGAPLRITLGARLQGGKLQTDVELFSAKRSRLRSNAQMDLDIPAPLPTKRRPIRIGALVVSSIIEALQLQHLPGVCRQTSGQIDGTIEAQAPKRGSAQASLTLAAKQFRFSGTETVDINMRSTLDRQALSATADIAHSDTPETKSTWVAKIPVVNRHQKLRLAPRRKASMKANFNRLPLAAVVPPNPSIAGVRGQLSGVVEMSETLEDPTLQGELDLHDVGFISVALAQPLRRINGKMHIDSRTSGGSLQLSDVSARDLGGTLKAEGQGELEIKPTQGRGKIVVHTKRFPLRHLGQVFAELDMKAEATAKVRKGHSELDIRLHDTNLWLLDDDLRQTLSLAAHPDIVNDNGPPLAETPTQPRTGTASIRVRAEDSFWVQRQDFAVKVSMDVKTELKPKGVYMNGNIDIQRGFLNLLGTNFDLQRGSTISFVGSSPPNPALDLVALHVNRSTSRNVTVHIGGRGDKPELTFRVDDAVVLAGEAVLAIYERPGQDIGSQDANAQAKSFVAAMMAGAMTMAARRELGAAAPILIIEPGDETRSSRVRAGFDLDTLIPTGWRRVIRGMYVEGIIASEEEGADSQGLKGGVVIEFYFPYDLIFRGSYMPGETWSLDVGWEP